MFSQRDNGVRPLEYPVLGRPVAAGEEESTVAERIRELEVRLREREGQFAVTLERARGEALRKGREMAESEQTALRQECSAQLRRAIDEFQSRSADYFARVEEEVVRLALAIAERILHREAQMDPLLLSGPVRVALGQLAASAQVRLRVPSQHLEMWTELVRLIPGLPLQPEVVADTQLETGEAILESSLGRVDLGVRSQMEEV
jgi:flagellar assembly protein FliH